MPTRREILAAVGLGATGGVVLASVPVDRDGAAGSAGESTSLADTEFSALVGVADVVYPSAVTVTPGFLSGYVGRLDQSRTSKLRAALRELNDESRNIFRSDFGAASPDQREALLRSLGVDSTYPRPNGTLSSRIRYHVVNGLLYALFTTPTGSELVGIDNPRGYPGGYYGSAQYPGSR